MKKILFVLTLIASFSSFAQGKKFMECSAGSATTIVFLENGSSTHIRLEDGNTGDEITYSSSRSLRNVKLNDSDTFIGKSAQSGYYDGEISDAILIRLFKNHQNRGFENVGVLAVGGSVMSITQCHLI